MTRNPRHSRISRMFKIHVYPLKHQKTHNFGKFREIRLPFFDLNNEKWNPLKFTANYAKIVQSATPSHESREIRAILEKSHQSLLPNGTPAFCSKFREIRSLRKDSERLTRN